jgi:hypothetical protein
MIIKVRISMSIYLCDVSQEACMTLNSSKWTVRSFLGAFNTLKLRLELAIW